MRVLAQTKYQDHIPCSFAYKLICVDDKLVSLLFFYRDENAAYKFPKPIFEECEYFKNVMNKHFTKNFIMIVDEEEQFQISSTCWIY